MLNKYIKATRHLFRNCNISVVNLYARISSQETKQNKRTNKLKNKSDLLTLTVYCEKRSFLVRSEKKRKNKNLTKITNEAIIVMIIIRTKRIENNRKTRHTEKKQ